MGECECSLVCCLLGRHFLHDALSLHWRSDTIELKAKHPAVRLGTIILVMVLLKPPGYGCSFTPPQVQDTDNQTEVVIVYFSDHLLDLASESFPCVKSTLPKPLLSLPKIWRVSVALTQKHLENDKFLTVMYQNHVLIGTIISLIGGVLVIFEEDLRYCFPSLKKVF